MTSPLLLIVEHDNKAPRENTRHVVGAAQQLSDNITALVIGHNCRAVADAVGKIAGVTTVNLVEDAALEHGLAENCAPIIADVAGESKYKFVMMASGAMSRQWLPRAAALADVQMLTDVTGIVSADTFVRPLYAGNALATVQCTDSTVWMSVRPTAFEAVEGDGNAEVTTLPAGDNPDKGLSAFVEQRVSALTRPELTSAKVVVSGGRGMGSADNFALIEKVADKINAAVGASRAAVDAGYVPNDYQVGQTGKIVAPDLYVAVGISGAIQHIAGMKDSKVIVAINKDPDAPIFEIADYGLVADLFEALPELASVL